MKLYTLVLLLFTSYIAFCNVVPVFSCDATKGCSPLVVNITDQSAGGVTSWYWDLGNGNISTQRNPAASYLNPGSYTIKLIVSDGTTTDSATQVITVFAKPLIDFSADRTIGCPNDSIHFTAISEGGDAPISQYAWGFGNGRGNNSVTTSYQYGQAGIYDVTLVVLDTNGCTANATKPAYIRIWPAPTASFTLTPAVTCGTSQMVSFTNSSQDTGLTYLWIFGDSTVSTQRDTSHLYTYGKYSPKLVVTNTNGCTSMISHDIIVINLHAAFTADKVEACAGEQISFTNMSPMPGASWNWDFGDLATSARQNPMHVYTQPGTYTVRFLITDGFCRDSTTRVAYIHITPGFNITFTPDQTHSCTTPFTVHFTSHTTTPVSYLWNLGNGIVDSTADPSTTYTTPSTFSVSVTATDASGCKVMVSAPGLIHTAKPLVKFTGDTLVCAHQAVSFSNATIGAAHYLWHFGDGDTSSAINPSHVYRSYGRFNVSLTATDSTGCDSTLTKVQFIRVDSARVDFHVDRAFSFCPPLVTSFRSVVNRSDLRLMWDFGDGYTDTAANPTHIYFQPGVYTVRLIGISHTGCSDTVTYPQLINVQGPSGHFTVTPDNGCTPLVVTFSGTVSANTRNITCDLGNGLLYTDSLNFSYAYTTPRTYHPKFIVTDHVGCSIPYELDSIIAHPTPSMALRDTSICAGRAVDISLGTDHYAWQASTCDTCGRVSVAHDSASTAVLTPSISTSYTVTASNSYGCSSTSRFTIRVVPIQIVAPHDTIRMCRSESPLLSTVPAQDATWTPATYLSDSTSLTPICTAATSISYTVVSHTGSGCAVSQQVPVRVIDRVTVALSADTTVCPGSAVELRVLAIDSSLTGVSYSWSPASYLDQSSGADVLAGMQAASQTFRVITTSGGCTRDTSEVTVYVRQTPIVRLPATIIATPHAEVALVPVSDGLTTHLWSATDALSCTECASATLTAITSQTVYLTGTDQYGCTAGDSMLIDILQCDPESIFVPNTFTPNGDGLHDILYLHSRTLSQLDHFRVFDRWGAMVYDGRDISAGWDGMINGKTAETGVYIYTISGKCDDGYDVQKNGSVTLLR